jgi:hypothetical protein
LNEQLGLGLSVDSPLVFSLFLLSFSLALPLPFPLSNRNRLCSVSIWPTARGSCSDNSSPQAACLTQQVRQRCILQLPLLLVFRSRLHFDCLSFLSSASTCWESGTMYDYGKCFSRDGVGVRTPDLVGEWPLEFFST